MKIGVCLLVASLVAFFAGRLTKPQYAHAQERRGMDAANLVPGRFQIVVFQNQNSNSRVTNPIMLDSATGRAFEITSDNKGLLLLQVHTDVCADSQCKTTTRSNSPDLPAS